jgi:ABC-type polysaccharide/polyol phosphate export permease
MTTGADVASRRGGASARWALIWTFALRDLRARFTATSLGLVWALVVPLATVLIYSTVFAVIFRAQAPPMGNGDAGIFAVWFFCGLVPWNMFSQSVNAALASIVGMGGMLQKVYIPSFVPVTSAVITVVLEKLLEAVVLLATLVLFLNVAWTWVLFPVVILGVAAFATSVGYVLAVANVHFRDTGQIFAIVLQMWFFLTPVMYPVDLIPEEWRGIPLRTIFSLNPMTQFVNITRDLLYGLTLPSAGSVLYVTVCTAAAGAVAVLVHRRWGRDLAEAI